MGAVRVDDVQGKEFRALVVSTVRTCADVPIPEDEIDFLSNPKVCGVCHFGYMCVCHFVCTLPVPGAV